MNTTSDTTNKKHSTLLVGFEAKDRINYPHLEAVIDLLKAEGELEYFHFRERGYFLADLMKFNRESLFFVRTFYTLLTVIIDYIKLSKKVSSFNNVIAIDNFSYIFASKCKSGTILWSHDFVSKDQGRSHTITQKLIASNCKKHLLRNKKLIIQDEDRRKIFFESLDIASDLDCYFLPVALPALKNAPPHNASSKPLLMQIGGINCFRSESDKLIQAYQKQSSSYTLLLHGFFDKKILPIIRDAEIPPLCSTVDVKPANIPQLLSLCDVGIVSYVSHDKNFYYIAHASGQVCEFLRVGKPLIVCGNTNLKNFVEEKGVGFYVEDLALLPENIDKILNNYEQYSQRCLELFHAEYDLNMHQQKLSQWLIT